MQVIDRKRIAAPRILRSPIVERYKAEVRAYLEAGNRGERPPKVPFDLVENSDLRASLHRLSKGKCAYCGSPIDQDGIVDAFRPVQGAENADGSSDYLHYCWLAVDWANLLLGCYGCVSQKGVKFPALERGPIGASITQLRRLERNTLLDPSWDAPSEHLRVVGGELIGTTSRGQLTIEVLDLNRSELVEQRSRVVRKMINRSTPAAVKVELLLPETPYSGIAWLVLLDHLPPRVARARRRYSTSRHTMQTLITQAFFGGDDFEDFEHRARERERRRYVRQVRVRNFRGIPEATIKFPRSDQKGRKGGGSLVILGDNGVGKTSLLQAAALGCLGPEHAGEIGATPRWCLAEGAYDGDVEVAFWGTDRKNIVRFERDAPYFTGKAEVPVMVLGYGAYRLAARRGVGEAKRTYDYRVGSLFSERQLVNGALGLRQHLVREDGAPDRDRLEDATRALNEVLQKRARVALQQDGQLVVEEYGRAQPLDELSSGFKSVVAITADIMDVMYEVWDGMTSAQALVLIDEIDAHLHPSWRLAIVEALRDTFPLTQFMLTTHDPLPLRGLVDGEIAILSRDHDGVSLDIPSVRSLEGMSVDQILTSDLFGLSTTLDPEMSKRLAEYYALLSRPALRAEDRRELETIADTLPPEIPLGDTLRERLMYRIVDTYLARHRGVRENRLEESTINELVDLFETAEREAIEQDAEGAV